MRVGRSPGGGLTLRGRALIGQKAEFQLSRLRFQLEIPAQPADPRA